MQINHANLPSSSEQVLEYQSPGKLIISFLQTKIISRYLLWILYHVALTEWLSCMFKKSLLIPYFTYSILILTVESKYSKI